MAHPYSNLNDEALFELYRQGELGAFDLYYERTSPKIWGYIRKHTNSNALAEDIYQEAWAKVHRSREQYDSKYPINPWVFTIVRSVLYDAFRSLKRKDSNEILLEPESMNHAVEQASVHTDIRQPTQDLEHLLGQLAPGQKELLELRYLKEWSFEEIAKSLVLNEVNIRQKISRILKQTRRRLE